MPPAFDRRTLTADKDPLQGLLDFTNLDQIVEQAGNTIRDAITNVIKQLTGLDLSSPEAFFASLAEMLVNGPAQVAAFIESIVSQIGSALLAGGQFIEDLIRNFFTAVDGLDNVPVIGDIAQAIEDTFETIEGFIEAITGVVQGDLSALSEWASRVPLLSLITGWLNGGVIPNLDASKITDGTFLESLIPSLSMEKIEGLIEAFANLPIISDIIALINRFIRPGGLPLIPLSSIADIQPNLLFEGGFDAAETVNTADGWSWDGTIGRGTPVGSAKIVANGTAKELQSGPDPILVEEGQELSLSSWVRWRSLATNGTGAPAQLTVRTYDTAGATVSTQTIAGLANSPGANSSNASQNDFVQLTGSWTVPAGVSSIRLRLTVRPSATAGEIWFDDAEVTKTQKMPQTFISGLTDALDNLFGWIEDLVNNLLGALGLSGSGSLLDRIFDLADEIGDWLLGTEDTAGALDDLAAALMNAPETVMGQLQAVSDIVSGIFNGWFGSGSTGDPAEVQYVIEAIKDTVTAGYNVTTFTSSGTWNKPPDATEIIAILIASGANGATGSTAKNSAGITVQGGSGGQDGSYVVQALQVADVPNSVPITIGINGGNTSFGSLVTVSPGAAGGMATQFGFSETTSLPGAGGKGGNVVTASSAATGNTGGSSAVAGGGSGGTGRNASGNGSGNNGDAGDNANPAAVTKCGGGGGGGGGGCYSAGTFVNATGGSGGPGGYPGGGGGGGGAAATAEAGNVATGGPAGPGAAGILWIYWR